MMLNKIAFLVPIVPPTIDGVGEYTFHLVKELRARGCDARLFTSSHQKPLKDWVYPSISQWNPEVVLEEMRKFSPDVCILQFVPQLYGKYGLCWDVCGIPKSLKKILSCRVGVTAHEFACGWGLAPKKLFLAASTRLQFLRLIQGADFAVTTCRGYERIIRSYSSDLKVKTIPVSANTELIPINVSALRERLGLQNYFLFSFFGRLADFKNPKLAVRVLKEAIAQGQPAKLAFIGCARSSEPELFEEILCLAKSLNVDAHILETGNLNHEEISQWLQASDVFLFPQRDGISTRNTTVMSAMAHGLPIIAFQPVKGNYEGYDLPHGSFVPTGDETAFIQKALEIATRGNHSALALRQKQYYADHFSWNQMASQYLELMTHGK